MLILDNSDLKVRKWYYPNAVNGGKSSEKIK